MPLRRSAKRHHSGNEENESPNADSGDMQAALQRLATSGKPASTAAAAPQQRRPKIEDALTGLAQQSKELFGAIQHHLQALESMQTAAIGQAEQAQAELLDKVKAFNGQQGQAVFEKELSAFCTSVIKTMQTQCSAKHQAVEELLAALAAEEQKRAKLYAAKTAVLQEAIKEILDSRQQLLAEELKANMLRVFVPYLEN